MRRFLLLFLIVSCSSPHYKKLEPSPGKVSFCIVGDVGNDSSSQRKVARAMTESGCEKLILLGDVIYPHGIKSIEDKVLKKRFIEPYKSFKSIYVVLGNHDYEGEPGAWLELSKKDSRIIHPGTFFREKTNNICLFFLDTNFSQAGEGLLEKESLWLKDSVPECGYNVAFSHHPFMSTGRHHGPARGDLKLFYEKFIVGRFHLIFSGHDHILRDEGMSGGTRQIISGAGGKHDIGYPPGYAVFILDLDDPHKSEVELRPL